MSTTTEKKMSTGEKWFIASAGLTALVCLLAIWFLQSMGSPSATPNAPFTTVPAPVSDQQNLTGNWVTDHNGVKLTATVTGDTIKIVMQGDNDTVIDWWDGSFQSLAKDGDVIASIKSNLTDNIMVSSEDKKIFTIGDGTMTFDIEFLGVKKTVTVTHV